MATQKAGAQKRRNRNLKIGDKAPKFEAQTTRGEINFPGDYHGKWVIFFSHPADFTPICTSEFMAVAAMSKPLAEINCEVVGLSCDTMQSHVEWLTRIRDHVEFDGAKNVEIEFPLIADWKMDIAHQYGMVHTKENATTAVRAVFIIDPKGIIRLISYYPNNIGRDIQEIYRAVLALQVSEKFEVYTPASWLPGDDVIDPSALNKVVLDHTDNLSSDLTHHDWFFWTKKLSKKEIMAGLKQN